jgi:hypothetical protein
LVTAEARPAVAPLANEVVRLVALGAGDPGVKVVLVCGLLVAIAARAGEGCLVARRVSDVTIGAARSGAVFRVVGRELGVAVRAGAGRALLHAVRRVAVRADLVLGNALAAQHVDAGVTGRTRLCVGFLEVVWAVAADTLAVSRLE